MHQPHLRSPLSALASAVVASGAHGATADISATYCTGDADVCRYYPDARVTIGYRADPGELNFVDVIYDGTVKFRDAGAVIAAKKGCSRISDHDATCPRSVGGGTGVAVLTKDGDDRVNLGVDASAYLGPGNDTGAGSPGLDEISGEDGRDVISGAGGDDSVEGGGSNDALDGGAGNDILKGDAGLDALVGATGRDRLNGGAGNDRLIGGPGRDRLLGGAGRDMIDAGPANDVVFARDGRRDRVRCGGGHDRAIADRFDVVRGCEQRAAR